MGLEIVSTAFCDKCGVVIVVMNNGALPDGCLNLQGYASIVAGETHAIVGLFCAVCVAAEGKLALAKLSVDLCPGLNE